jgi:hypothetical protein
LKISGRATIAALADIVLRQVKFAMKDGTIVKDMLTH